MELFAALGGHHRLRAAMCNRLPRTTNNHVGHFLTHRARGESDRTHTWTGWLRSTLRPVVIPCAMRPYPCRTCTHRHNRFVSTERTLGLRSHAAHAIREEVYHAVRAQELKAVVLIPIERTQRI